MENSENKTWLERSESAKAALSYITNIAQKLPNKLRIHPKPKEKFKILIKDSVPYNSYGMDMAMKTFKRKNIDGYMSRYKKLTSGKYAYIFTFVRS